MRYFVEFCCDRQQAFTHFFNIPSKKFATYMFKTRGGGSKAFLTMFKKTDNMEEEGIPKGAIDAIGAF